MRGTNWHSVVSQHFPGWTLLDPRECKSKDPAVYTEWDLDHIDKAWGVLAYMDSDNPSGLGMMFEVGYACASDKFIAFVDAMRDDDPRRKYFDMLRVRANVVAPTIEQMARLVP